MRLVDPGVLEDISLPLERFLLTANMLSVDEEKMAIETHCLGDSTLNGHRPYVLHRLQHFGIDLSALNVFKRDSWYDLQGVVVRQGTLVSDMVHEL